MSGRTIVKNCPTGTTYIPINRYAQNISIQAVQTGGGTVGLDYTLDNIIRGKTNPNDVDVDGELVGGGGAANWTLLVAAGAGPLAYQGSLNAYAIRVVCVTGTARVVISQSSEIV